MASIKSPFGRDIPTAGFTHRRAGGAATGACACIGAAYGGSAPPGGGPGGFHGGPGGGAPNGGCCGGCAMAVDSTNRRLSSLRNPSIDQVCAEIVRVALSGRRSASRYFLSFS